MPFTAAATPIFDGINYQVQAVRIETYLDANDLWKAIEQVQIYRKQLNKYMKFQSCEIIQLAQIKNHKGKKQRASKANTTLFATVSPVFFLYNNDSKDNKGHMVFSKKRLRNK